MMTFNSTRSQFLLRVLPVLAFLVLLVSACGDSTSTPLTSNQPTASVAANPGATTAASIGTTTTAATAGSVTPRGILTVSLEGNTTWSRNFNPFSSTALYPTSVGIYEPLLIYNPTKGETVPWLATEYKWSDSNKTLTFTIRDNVKWSDGQAFSAEDVAYTLNLKKQFPALLGSNIWDYLSDVKATNATTLVCTFKTVYTPGLYDIGQSVIVPEHVWKTIADPVKFTNPDPIASGPFTVIKDFQDQVYEVDRNPNYWQAGKPYIQGLRMPAYAGNDQANLATINGQNDWGSQFIPDIDKTFVSKDPAHNYYWFPATGGLVQLYVNTTKKPFDDPNVRKAISMAINRDQIVKVAMFGYAKPADATGLTDAYADWKNQAAATAGDWVKLNVDKANQLLDAAGLKRGSDGIRTLSDGTPMKYDIIVGASSTDWVASSQIIAQNLKQVGMDVSVKGQDWGAVIDQKSKGQFDMAHSWSSAGPTPFNFFRGAMSSQTAKPVGQAANENYQRYVDPKADELLTQFAATADIAKQKDLANQLQQLYVEDAPGIPLFPSPEWGEFNTSRFTGFPNKDNPYALRVAGNA